MHKLKTVVFIGFVLFLAGVMVAFYYFPNFYSRGTVVDPKDLDDKMPALIISLAISSFGMLLAIGATIALVINKNKNKESD